MNALRIVDTYESSAPGVGPRWAVTRPQTGQQDDTIGLFYSKEDAQFFVNALTEKQEALDDCPDCGGKGWQMYDYSSKDQWDKDQPKPGLRVEICYACHRYETDKDAEQAALQLLDHTPEALRLVHHGPDMLTMLKTLLYYGRNKELDTKGPGWTTVAALIAEAESGT